MSGLWKRINFKLSRNKEIQSRMKELSSFPGLNSRISGIMLAINNDIRKNKKSAGEQCFKMIYFMLFLSGPVSFLIRFIDKYLQVVVNLFSCFICIALLVEYNNNWFLTIHFGLLLWLELRIFCESVYLQWPFARFWFVLQSVLFQTKYIY